MVLRRAGTTLVAVLSLAGLAGCTSHRTVRRGHRDQPDTTAGTRTSTPTLRPVPDGASYRAFVFTKGRAMVVVHTMQTNASQNAVDIAAVIAGKF